MANLPRQAAATFLVDSSAFCEFSKRGPHRMSATPSSWAWEQCVTTYSESQSNRLAELAKHTSLAACKANNRFFGSVSTIFTMAGRNWGRFPTAIFPAEKAAAARTSSCSKLK